MRRREAVQRQRRVAHAAREVARRPALDRGVEIDVLVVLADGGLGRRREDRFRQLLRELQARGQRMPQTAPVAW